MRKNLICIGVLLVLLSACGPKGPTATPVDVSAVQTTVVQTVFAGTTQTAAANVPTDTPMPTNTFVPTPTASGFPTSTSIPTEVVMMPSTASSILSLSLEDFPNKALLGEDESYSVYLINSDSGDSSEKTGEIIIYDKGKDVVYPIIGSFKFFGTTRVSNDGKGEYLLLEHGTYTSHAAIVISLNDKKQAVDEFCITASHSNSHFFWSEYIIFNNCDIVQNRPWGVGEAPSVVATNLKTGQVTQIAKSDLTHQFYVQAITDNNLQYLETSVEKEEDWQDPAKQNTSVQTYDLLSLEN